MPVIDLVTVLLAGFSIVSAAILLIAYLFLLPQMRKTRRSKFWCFAMLTGLALLQACHVGYFAYQMDILNHGDYGWLILLMPSCFFFFSRSVLFLETPHRLSDLCHAVPIVVGVFLPNTVLPIYAFLVGSGYTLWFANTVYQLRSQRARFKFEMFFFGLFAVMAIIALFLIATIPFVSAYWFFSVYSNAISLSFILIVTALLVFPELLADIAEIVETNYAKSQLTGLDIAGLRQQLEDLMIRDKRYQDEALSLNRVAEEMDISAHQLSELINTQYGYGFPKLVREHRVRAAQALLLSEPDTSILAIGMETGFRSQSAFYSAFKESVGISPGEFRKQQNR